MLSKRSYKAAALAAGVALVATGGLVRPAEATIFVSIVPSAQVVNIADGTATVDIVAVIPEADAIVSWGLDLELAGTSVSELSVAINEPLFTPVVGADGDAYAALVTVPPGDAVWSDPVPLLLATVTFSLDELGLTTLTLSDDNAEGDLTEGFGLEPPPAGAFAEVQYTGGSITVVPEPATVMMIALGAFAVVARRRSR